MADYTTGDIRNLALVGSGNSGKTTLIEALLHKAGAINTPGDIERGTTVCDFEAEEKTHGHSLTSSVAHCDLGGQRDREGVDPAADRREGDRPRPGFHGELQRAAITRGQQLRLAVLAAVPHRADGVDHVARRQVVAAGQSDLAGRTAAERPALLEQLRAGGAVDRAVDASAAEQRRVRGVDDGVDLQSRDVVFDDPDPRAGLLGHGHDSSGNGLEDRPGRVGSARGGRRRHRRAGGRG